MELRETLTYIYQFVLKKGYDKDTDEQLHEKLQKARTARVLSAGASVPMEEGCAFQHVDVCVHQPGSSPTPHFRNFWRLPHVSMSNY